MKNPVQGRCCVGVAVAWKSLGEVPEKRSSCVGCQSQKTCLYITHVNSSRDRECAWQLLHGSSLQERLIRRSGFMCAHKTAITVSPLSYVYLASSTPWIGACQFNLCVFCKTGQSSPWLSEGTFIEHQVPSGFSVLSDRTSVFHNHICIRVFAYYAHEASKMPAAVLRLGAVRGLHTKCPYDTSRQEDFMYSGRSTGTDPACSGLDFALLPAGAVCSAVQCMSAVPERTGPVRPVCRRWSGLQELIPLYR